MVTYDVIAPARIKKITGARNERNERPADRWVTGKKRPQIYFPVVTAVVPS